MQYCQDMAKPAPTHTSFAVLGLLSLRPWTAYELARQSERSLRWFFPRAERAVYLEVKRLVALGWARDARATTGRRASTVYSITRTGETALHAWLGTPSGGTEIVSEAALKMFFADQDGTAQLRATVDGMRAHADQSLSRLSEMASEPSGFPERMSTNVLSMRLIADIYRAIREWTDWADDAVDVLVSGNPEAVREQTDDALRAIREEAN